MNTKIVKNAKHLLTIVAGTVLFFSAVNLYMANIVTINDDMPKTIQSGSTVPVTITIEKGNVKMKTYKQMKMYNDESLNPVLYQKSKN